MGLAVEAVEDGLDEGVLADLYYCLPGARVGVLQLAGQRSPKTLLGLLELSRAPRLLPS
jgi:hypothetical protein